MLKKFALWFICFGLSFFVADVFGWTDQGRAFLYIYLGSGAAIVLALILLVLIVGIAYREKLAASGISFLMVFTTATIIAVELFATWVATKLFGVDFFATFQIMTFGACLATGYKSKNNDN